MRPWCPPPLRSTNRRINSRRLLQPIWRIFVVHYHCRLWEIFIFSHLSSSGSSGQVRGAEKQEIYAATFGSHLSMTHLHRAGGGHGPLGPPGSATAISQFLWLITIAAHGRSSYFPVYFSIYCKNRYFFLTIC